MSVIQGEDFRATAGFVIDPTNFEFRGADQFHGDYPLVLSPSGLNGGWEDVTDSRDRSALTGAAASLAGLNFVTGGTSSRFRIDLPATGNYSVNAAFGDAVYSRGAMTAEFQDNTTTVATPVNNVGTSAGGHFIDASGVERTSPTDWVNNNAPVTLNLTNTAGPGGTTIFRCKITNQAASGVIATLFIQSAGGAAHGLKRAANLDGLGASGPFFADPLAA